MNRYLYPKGPKYLCGDTRPNHDSDSAYRNPMFYYVGTFRYSTRPEINTFPKAPAGILPFLHEASAGRP